MPRPVPTQRCWGNSCVDRSSTKQGVGCDHAESPKSPRIHCRCTHKHEGLTSIHRAGRPPSQTCGTSGMEPAVLHVLGLRAGAGSANRDVKPGRWYSRRPHMAASPCDFPRLLEKVHVLHTGESDADRAGSFRLLGQAAAELPDPRGNGHFTDRARPEHQDRQHHR